MVVIGVVARQLTAARHGEQSHLAVSTVHGGEGGAQSLDPLALNGRAALGAEGLEGGVQLARVDGG